jgi:hypothetical protein
MSPEFKPPIPVSSKRGEKNLKNKNPKPPHCKMGTVTGLMPWNYLRNNEVMSLIS